MFKKIKPKEETNPHSLKNKQSENTPPKKQASFKNTPLLDFSISTHRLNFQKAIEEWKTQLPLHIPIVINNKVKTTSTIIKRGKPFLHLTNSGLGLTSRPIRL